MLQNGTLQNGTHTLWYGMLHNSTLQLQQPMNWLGVKPNLT